ncbi:MAG: bthL, partial [Chloroflexi bacterium]|nr:bthL [Chloroflexota bacterium]
MRAFVIDVTKCSGCYSCQLVCKDEHCGNDWTPYAKPQPEVGQFWGKLNEYVRGTVPQVKMAYVFRPCQHCDNASCIPACPLPDVIYRRDDGLVIIDPKKCSGCRKCVAACPYGAIYFNESLKIAQKCTGCAHLLDRGWQEPRCVDVCAHGALKFGEESDLAPLISKAEILNPEFGLKARVYYIGLPKRFIAGTLYNPITREVINSAKCTLSGGGRSYTAISDEFGDFWFEGLEVGSYSLTIESGGRTMVKGPIRTEEDVSLGDLALD